MFGLKIPFFDLDKIYDSGQAFRWIKVGEDKKYIVIKDDNITLVRQKGEHVTFECSEDEFYEIWYDYFDIGFDYLTAWYKIKAIDRSTRIAANRSKGVHLLNLPLFEAIICCVLEAGTGYKTIRSNMKWFSQMGTKHKNALKEAGTVTWYEFPTAQQILGSNYDGYKADVINSLCQDVVDGWLDLDYVQSETNKEELIEYLTQFDGIGKKVAEQICLFGLGMKDTFPIDRHIGNFIKSLGFDREEFEEWFLEGIPYCGILRQYLWYHLSNPPKRIEQWMEE